MLLAFVLLSLLTLSLGGLSPGKIRVSCVGDSITSGGCGTKHPYPQVLQKILGKGYHVTNFGDSGKTMLKKGLCFESGGDCSYWNTPTWSEMLKSNPDIVTVMLGTNDAKSFNWFGVQERGDSFAGDYYTMVRQLLSLPSKPKVYLLLPPPLYPPGFADMNATVINYFYPKLIPRIGRAAHAEAKIIDVFDALGGTRLDKPHLFCDGCHPIDEGYEVIARTIADVIIQDSN